MTCREARRLIGDQLVEGMIPLRRTPLDHHLARCAACRETAASLAATHERVTGALAARTAADQPSPLLWQRIEAALAPPGRDALPAQPITNPPSRIRGTMMKRRTFVSTLGVLAVALGVVATAAPGVGAQLQQQTARLGAFFIGSEQVAISPRVTSPLLMDYHSILELEPDHQRMLYRRGDRFVMITDRKSDGATPAPAGTPVTVSGRAGVLSSGLSGTIDSPDLASFAAITETLTPAAGPADPRGGTAGERVPSPLDRESPPAGPIHYRDARQLTWTAGDRTMELLSNLPADEMLAIANSLMAN